MKHKVEEVGKLQHREAKGHLARSRPNLGCPRYFEEELRAAPRMDAARLMQANVIAGRLGRTESSLPNIGERLNEETGTLGTAFCKLRENESGEEGISVHGLLRTEKSPSQTSHWPIPLPPPNSRLSGIRPEDQLTVQVGEAEWETVAADFMRDPVVRSAAVIFDVQEAVVIDTEDRAHRLNLVRDDNPAFDASRAREGEG